MLYKYIVFISEPIQRYSVTVCNITCFLDNAAIYKGGRERKDGERAGEAHVIDGSYRLFLLSYVIYSPVPSPNLFLSDVTFSSRCALQRPSLSSLFYPMSRSVRLTASCTLEVTAALSFVTRRHDAPTQRIRERDAPRGASRRRARLIRRTATINSRISAPARFHVCPSCRKSSR